MKYFQFHNQKVDVQQTTCMLDVMRVCEPKEDINSVSVNGINCNKYIHDAGPY